MPLIPTTFIIPKLSLSIPYSQPMHLSECAEPFCTITVFVVISLPKCNTQTAGINTAKTNNISHWNTKIAALQKFSHMISLNPA